MAGDPVPLERLVEEDAHCNDVEDPAPGNGRRGAERADTTRRELVALLRPHRPAAKAVVVDLGGALSHAAIVARELGIPCVVNTRTGGRVSVYGDTGLCRSAHALTRLD